MAIQKTDKIWHNGKFIAWDDATLHVMSHVVHYGSSVFEGIRCYALPTGPRDFPQPPNTCSASSTPLAFTASTFPSPATKSCAPWSNW